MPNWSDDEGRYWYWDGDKRPFWDAVQIPHVPAGPPVAGCTCSYCVPAAQTQDGANFDFCWDKDSDP